MHTKLQLHEKAVLNLLENIFFQQEKNRLNMFILSLFTPYCSVHDNCRIMEG